MPGQSEKHLVLTLSPTWPQSSGLPTKEPPAPALEVVGDKARRRLDRPSRKRFAVGGGVMQPGRARSNNDRDAGADLHRFFASRDGEPYARGTGNAAGRPKGSKLPPKPRKMRRKT